MLILRMGAVTMSHSLLPMKAANTLVMHAGDHINFQIPYLQHQSSLTLSWPLVAEWGIDCVTFSFAYNGCHYVAYAWGRPHQVSITLLSWQKIVDNPLTLIVSIRQWLCRFLFCLSRLPIRWLCITASISPSNFLTAMTRNHWHSIDGHFQHVAVTVSVSVLPIKTAHSLVIHNSEQITVQFPHLQNQKSLTLSWCSV